MKHFFKKISRSGTVFSVLFLTLFLCTALSGCTPSGGSDTKHASDAAIAGEASADASGSGASAAIDKDGSYTTKDDVALYLYTYGTLPGNFITKKEAQSLGWSGGSLEPYAPGKCIGGDYFGNYEGLLPEQSGRDYHECDIDTLGQKSRGAKRIVYSNDGLIFYTGDHYSSFEQLYQEESDNP